jgi:Tfp pilus assembly protein PilF
MAMSINPGKAADIHNNLGAALLVNGNIKEAAVQFHLALQIAPNHIDALKNLRKVSASHGKQSENSTP